MSDQQRQAAGAGNKPDAAAVAAQAAQQVLNGQDKGGEKSGEGTTGAPAVGEAVAGDKKQQQAPAVPPAQPQQPYYPKEFADTWKGNTDQETIDNLAKHIGGFPKAPAKAEDYKLELTGEMAKSFGDLSKDPAMQAFRGVALKHGLSQAAFEGVFKDFYGQLVAEGVWKPMSNEQIYKTFDDLGGEEKDPVRRRAEGARRLSAAQAAVNGLVTRQVLSTSEANLLNALSVEAEGVTIIEKLMQQMGEHGPQMGGSGGQQVADSEEARAAVMFPSMKKP